MTSWLARTTTRTQPTAFIMSERHEFSEVFRHSSLSTCQFSPGTTFFAAVIDNHVIVRSTQTMQVVRLWTCSPPNPGLDPTSEPLPDLKYLAWSSESTHILVFAPKLALAWVFALGDPGDQPAAVIMSGPEGMVRCRWSPSGREVLAFSELGVSHIHVMASVQA